MVGALIGAYILFKRLSARYAVVGILVLGLGFLLMQERVNFTGSALEFADSGVPHAPSSRSMRC